jgi:MoaA/NifB/PqqE/SkfB family radical SAM enzyme
MACTFIGFEITDRCDLACSHCLRAVVPPHAPQARDLPLALVQRLIGEGRALGMTDVGFTGGEPMLHPDFLGIVDAAVDAGMVYRFLTNGLGLPEFIGRWMARPKRRNLLRQVCVSLDGATEPTHERIRGRGTFRRTLAGIATLRALGIPFTILATITRTNRHEIDQMGLLAHHLGAEQLCFSHFLPNGRLHATEDLDLPTLERHEAERMVKRLMHAMRFRIGMMEGYFTDVTDHQCGTVQLNSVNVDPSGHLTFCCELSNFHGDERPAETRSDVIADLATTSLAEGIRRLQGAIDRFRQERLAEEAAGLRTEDDRFACRYCVRHFGKPERGLIRISRRPSERLTG